jgi:dTDP-4-dehydrorhamnose reductase
MKIMITGSNGLVGRKLLEALEAGKHTVLATSRGANRAPAGRYQYEALDITDEKQVSKAVRAFKPEALIHCAAMTLVDACETHREECWKTNVDATCHLLHAAEAVRCHFIHLSTDMIFDGEAGPYKEEAAPNPLNFYGTSKLAAEQAVQDSTGPWTIIRTILVYGVIPHSSRSNLVLRVKGNLEAGKPIRIVTDQFRMPTLAEDLVKACLTAAEKKVTGIYHVSGSELMSIYETAKTSAEFFGLDSSLIQPVETAELQEPAQRPKRTGFYLDKARRDLDFHPTPLLEGLKTVREQLKKTGF